MASGAPASTPASFLPEGMLLDLLAISLNGVNVLRPVYESSGELVDFAIEYLNPAAQRMTGKPERPGGTTRAHFPDIFTNGVFDFYRQVFETDEAGHFELYYRTNGYDNYYHVAARRSGEWLLVSFTDTSDQPRTAAEEALRQSQAREQAARAAAEAQRIELQSIFAQAPIALARLRGPAFVVEWANARMEQIWGRPLGQIVGRPHFEALPDLAGQGFEAVFAGVYQTGEPCYFRELLVSIAQAHQAYQGYFNITYQPAYDEQGHITGIIASAIEVTEQVRARQQVQRLNQELEERVQARTRELAEQQRLLQQILAQVPAAITTLRGPDHRFTFANDRYQHLVEGRVQVGRTVAETLPEVAEQGYIELLDHVYRSSQPFEGKGMALLLAQPEGPPVQHHLDFTYQPLPDEHGQTQGLLVFAVDVTAQVRTRQQAAALQAQLLAAARQQAAERLAFYQIFEQTPALVALLRAPGHRFEYVNPAYQALFPNPLVGRDAAEAAPELAAQGFVALLDRVYQTGETYFGHELPFTPVLASGQPAQPNYFDFTYQAYRENGEVAGISIIAFNVTEQVLARQERATQQRQLREVFAQAPVAIGVFRGSEYVFDIVNPLMVEMVGRDASQLVGQPFFAALPELATQGLRELLDGVRLTGVPFVAQEQEIHLARHGPGATGFYNFVYQPLRDEHGQVTAITCVATDMTEQVRARQQVQRLNEELAAINEELAATNEELHESNHQLTRTNVDLDNFIYTASHDLKAPISNIEGLLLALEHELPAAGRVGDVPHMLSLMHQATERFQRTILHLTDVSRLQQEHNHALEHVSPAVVIEAVRLDLLPLLQQTQAQLAVQVSASVTLNFSEKNLRSVIYNLLSNALKYRHPDRVPQVAIRYELQRDYQVLEVEDNGLGLDLSQGQDKLFAMFQRLHTHVEGTGIGLYMVKKMLENVGGRIEVESQLGEGTTFRVYFRR